MESYSEQIAEVFIKPIRSVLIVDDRFPTIDSLLDEKPCAPAEKERLSALISFCRDKRRHWLVDVHDGKGLVNPAELPYSSLRQCDLLVLDYNLDGDSMDGSQAIEIIRQLAESENFNLAVVYTSQDTQIVFEEIFAALSADLRSLSVLSDAEKKEVEDALDEAEDSDTDIRSKLAKLITHRLCLSLQRNGISTQNHKNKDLLTPLLDLLPPSIFKSGQIKDLLLKRLLMGFVARQASGTTFPVTLSDSDTPARWLIAGNAFIAIASKIEIAPTELIEHLMRAIEDWKPSPNRLIFAKLRATLESSGLTPEKEIFQDQTLQAFWLHKLLNTQEIERPHYIGSLLDKQMEMLTDALRSKVIEFTQRVVSTSLASAADPVKVTQQFFSIDPMNAQKRALGLVAHNTHVSTKERGGKNLVPGHVLHVSGKDSGYWICLSPACDLEAGRKSSGRDFKKRVYPWMPFTALKLYKMSNTENALAQATKGWVLFLKIGDKKQQFSFFKDSDPNNNPVWEEFLAAKEGRLTDNYEIQVARVDKIGKDTESSEDILPPSYKQQTATIVAQVRSEYASSLTLRLTSHLSRIGLDYLGSFGDS